jgi:serine/threonine protein kinase
MVFMAIASKNNFVTHDEAAQCLAEFQAQPGTEARRSIEEILSDKGLLTAQQIQLLSAAARKVITNRAAPAAPPPAPDAGPPRAAAPAEGGSRPDTRSRPVNPNEPIPGIRIAGKLGVGGTATVFLAEDHRNARKVALKIIHPSLAKDEKAVRRFRREAELLCSFDHPCLVKGYSHGMMGPLCYLVMEFLEGESAQEVLDREKQFSEARSLEIILEAAKAIDHMQSRGIIHRDIKPGNIFLCKDGKVKVLDLGFAQPITGDGAGGEEETTSGTVQYMSPEQARGQRDLDVRADIYSLGATLYHMVMGELPFTGSDSLEVMAKQVMEALNGEIKNRRLSKHMHYFIERMMSKDKDLRYATPRELVDDINEQIEGFKSLEYRPGEGAPASNVTRAITRRFGEPPPERPTTRRLRPTTRKISKIDHITKRFRKK